MIREKEKELIVDLLRLLRRYKDYDNPYIRNDGDIVIPLDAYLKKSRQAHSKVAEVVQGIINDDPTFKKRNSTCVE